jgi:hypothetical protein
MWVLTSCSQSFSAPTTVSQATSNLSQAGSTSELNVLSAIDPGLIEYQAKSVVIDTRTGAIGSNRSGYQSVGFQRYSSNLIIYGILMRNISSIDAGLKVAEYAFTYQNQDGSFKDASKKTGVSTPTSVAFFLQDLGHSLLLCQQSSWFQTSPKTANVRRRLNNLQAPTNRSTNWLLGKQRELLQSDGAGRATNRLFFDALAFYLTGKALRINQAVSVGERFARSALEQQSGAGFFLEKQGQDTSYQGVSLNKALVLLTNLKPGADLRTSLLQAIQRGVNWQLPFILPTGEISTTGNSRVYPGGETYQGKEKKVDYLASVLALSYYSVVSGNQDARNTANRILAFYQTN